MTTTNTTWSYSMGTGAIETDSAITAGTLAPNSVATNQIEIRINNLYAGGTTPTLTKKDVELALERLFQFIVSDLSTTNDLL